MTDSIKYKNSWYEIRIIDHHDFGSLYFGSTHLCYKIFANSEDPVSKEAEMVDEQIYFYVAPSLFKLSDAELKRRFF